MSYNQALSDNTFTGEVKVSFFRRGKKKSPPVYVLKGYTGDNRWRKVGEFDDPASFDAAIDEVDNPQNYKRFKLIKTENGKYAETVWKEENPDYEPSSETAISKAPDEIKKYVKAQIESAFGEVSAIYEARMEAGMKILEKAYTSSIDIMTEAMKASAKVEVEGVKSKIEQAKELVSIASPSPSSTPPPPAPKEKGFMSEIGDAIKEGVGDAIKEGIKKKVKERGVKVPER